MPTTIAQSSADIITQVDNVGFILDADTPDPDTTTDAAHSRGDTAISVADEGGAADGDLVRIGSGDTLEIGVVASATSGQITLDQGLFYDQPSGVAVVEQVKVNAGHVEEGGVDFNISEDIFEAGAATSAKTLVRKTVRITQGITWPAIQWSALMFDRAFGIPDVSFDGSGTATAPNRSAIASDLVKTVTFASVYVECTTEDGDSVEFQGWNLTPDLNKSWNISRNSVASITMGGDVKTTVLKKWTP